jgi:hypothetical protein
MVLDVPLGMVGEVALPLAQLIWNTARAQISVIPNAPIRRPLLWPQAIIEKASNAKHAKTKLDA